MAHDCIKRINDQLAPHNTRIAQSYDLSGSGRELIHVGTVKADIDVRKKPMNLFATFCPFCGEKLKGAAS